jgi:enterochelin esterase-like enzyme
MNVKIRHLLLLLLAPGLLALMACEPLVPTPTPYIIVVTATASPGPTATYTPTITLTPAVTDTPTPLPATATPEALCTDTEGQIIVIDEFESEVAGRNMPYRVYLPPCYFEAQRRYPVVYLLHGASNDDTHWQDLGIATTMNQGLALNLFPPMILVMPYGGELEATNTFPPSPSMETFLLEELIPRVERDLCVWEDREHRAIGGISRGGFWALSIAMRYPEVFSAVGGHSPALDEDSVRPEFNPLDLALNAPFIGETLRIYLDNSASDIVRTNVELLSSRLGQRQISNEYVINPLGEHNDAYWSSHLADYLAFYGGMEESGWPRDTGQLPSCLEPSP